MKPRIDNIGLAVFIGEATEHFDDCRCDDCRLRNLVWRLELVAEDVDGLPCLDTDTDTAIELLTAGLAAFKRAKRAATKADETNFVKQRRIVGAESEKAAKALIVAAGMIDALADLRPYPTNDDE